MKTQGSLCFPGTFKTVCKLPNGGSLSRAKNEAGGYTYFSDEIGGGVVVWDTCLVDKSTLLTAIAQESIRETS